MDRQERMTIDPDVFRQRLARNRQNTKKHFSMVHQQGVTATTLPRWGTVKHFVQGVYDQGQIGSCTANSLCGAYKLLSAKQGKNVDFEPSRMFVYWCERHAELQAGDNISDSGADVVDGDKYVMASGVCSETSCPYDDSTVNTQPSEAAFTEAPQHKISGYTLIPCDENLLTNIKATIVSGSPVNIAVEVYASFQSNTAAQTGMIPIPNPVNWGDQNDPRDALDGGHEMLIVGYNDDTQLFTVLNSWGSTWGCGGFCYMPYSYITNTNLGSEFTVIEL